MNGKKYQESDKVSAGFILVVVSQQDSGNSRPSHRYRPGQTILHQ